MESRSFFPIRPEINKSLNTFYMRLELELLDEEDCLSFSLRVLWLDDEILTISVDGKSYDDYNLQLTFASIQLTTPSPISLFTRFHVDNKNFRSTLLKLTGGVGYQNTIFMHLTFIAKYKVFRIKLFAKQDKEKKEKKRKERQEKKSNKIN
ncbi:hypothetical protein V1477_007645 [Vespula maculifrons]|uniref:Uncharacterized protein n=1 Tax=Vespula maculifrons TaxID=7453 RepID=A0ABD2CGF5_VESMC